MARQKETGTSFESFLHSLTEHPPLRVPGTATFMAGNPDGVPDALLRDFAWNKVLHERGVLLTVIIRAVAWVNPSERLEIQTLVHGFYRVIVILGSWTGRTYRKRSAFVRSAVSPWSHCRRGFG